jgi:2'-hydroxyisoflavone reductase
MRLLVLGGTWFLGKAIVDDAVDRGWEVTTFNRGRFGAPTMGVNRIIGDREDDNDLRRLRGSGPWDAVLDVAGNVPTVVRNSVRALIGVAHRYVYISTVGAYRDWPFKPVSERSPRHPCDPDFDPGTRSWDPASYGPLKAGCEAAIQRDFPATKILIVRPGVILGPNEYVGRMRWWLGRIQRGGRILAPGPPDREIQTVDVRDLSIFVLNQVDLDYYGVLNVTSLPGRDTYRDLLRACARVTGANPEISWVDEHWLIGRGVRQWTELPLWWAAQGTWRMDVTSAHDRGLKCRPLVETVADTYSWLASGGQPVWHERESDHGIDPQKELALLADASVAGAVVRTELLT